MQMALAENGEHLWKQLMVQRKTMLEDIKSKVLMYQTFDDNRKSVHITVPNSLLSKAFSVWEKHLKDISGLLSQFFSRKVKGEMMSE